MKEKNVEKWLQKIGQCMTKWYKIVRGWVGHIWEGGSGKGFYIHKQQCEYIYTGIRYYE